MPSTHLPQFNLRVPQETKDLCALLAAHFDRSWPWVVAEALRTLARLEGVPAPPPAPEPQRRNPKKSAASPGKGD